MNIEASRRVRVTLSKVDLIRMLKEAFEADIHVQSLPTDGRAVEMAITDSSVQLTWWSGPLSQRELPLLEAPKG